MNISQLKNIKKWTAALRGGKYKQCKNNLKKYDTKAHKTKYCCLGVACSIFDLKQYGEIINGKDFYKTFGILNNFQFILTRANDEDGLSFKEIADIIDKKASNYKVTK